MENYGIKLCIPHVLIIGIMKHNKMKKLLNI